MILNELESLIKSTIPQISTAAEKALNANTLYKTHQISTDEYLDLIDDITRIDYINKEMETELIYMSIVNAYKLISQLKTLISL